MRVVDSPCAECALGPNSPFTEEIKARIRGGTPHTCHWREVSEGVEHPEDCFGLNGRGTSSGPLCATAVALAGEQGRHEPVRVFGQEDVRRRLPEGCDSMTMVIGSPHGNGRFVIER